MKNSAVGKIDFLSWFIILKKGNIYRSNKRACPFVRFLGVLHQTNFWPLTSYVLSFSRLVIYFTTIGNFGTAVNGIVEMEYRSHAHKFNVGISCAKIFIFFRFHLGMSVV